MIICRFRFNEVLSRADYCIRIAMQFNAKEDEIKLAALQTKRVPARVARRLELLHDDIVEATRSAGQEMSRLEPIVIYMRLYRLLGVVVFAAIRARRVSSSRQDRDRSFRALDHAAAAWRRRVCNRRRESRGVAGERLAMAASG
ncbi:MAG TPA: hypothetical protein VEK11_03290 [Thermoanaerobaculia bacterium]|nr:hypothetical protein [Thermoanaerobaculia bacterium]